MTQRKNEFIFFANIVPEDKIKHIFQKLSDNNWLFGEDGKDDFYQIVIYNRNIHGSTLDKKVDHLARLNQGLNNTVNGTHSHDVLTNLLSNFLELNPEVRDFYHRISQPHFKEPSFQN